MGYLSGMPDVLVGQLPVPPNAGVATLRWRRATSLDEVDAWEHAWRELDPVVACPLGRFSWTRAFVRAFAADVSPWLVGVMRQGRCTALAPLVRKRLHGVRRMFLAGVGELHEPMDLVWSDERALDRLLRTLARGGSPLVFERVFADSPSIQKLRRAYRFRAVVLARPQSSCPYIALDESWLDPETHLNSERRSELRRARHKAEQLGLVTTEIHVPDLCELSQLLDTAFEVEASGWKGEGGTALAQDAHRSAFYRQYAEAACVEGTLRICFLRIGDRVAAMQLAVEDETGFWLLKAGRDARFAHCSPGMLLARDTIRYAAEAGLKFYEFLGKPEDGTRVWTHSEHPCVSLRVYPLGIRGLSALAVDAAVRLRRKWSRARCG